MVLTRDGINVIAARATGDNGGKYFTHVAIGTGSRKETRGDQALASEIATSSGARLVIVDNGSVATFGTQFRVQARLSRGLFPGTNTITIREVGIFDSDTGGKLLARVTLPNPVSLTIGSTTIITMTVDITPK